MSGVLLVLAACQITTGPALAGLELRVEAADLAMNRGGAEYMVPYVVENRTRETLHLGQCGDDLLFELQRYDDGRWVGVRAALCLAIYEMAPLRLEPGARVAGLEPVGTSAGRYRLVIAVHTRAGELRSLVSNPFIID